MEAMNHTKTNIPEEREIDINTKNDFGKKDPQSQKSFGKGRYHNN